MLFRKPIPTLAMIALALVLPTLSFAGSATISWRANTESDLSGYRVYYGTASRSYGPPVPAGKVTQYTLANLTNGKTYYFGVTALDFSGNESGYSAEAKKTITATTSTSGTTTTTAAGSYQVALWWSAYSSRYNNVPVRIYDGSTLLKTVRVNQQSNGGRWNVLGTFSFKSQPKVVVVSETTQLQHLRGCRSTCLQHWSHPLYRQRRIGNDCFRIMDNLQWHRFIRQQLPLQQNKRCHIFFC